MPQKSLDAAIASVLSGSTSVPGNIDLYAQPKLKNPDGTISTVDSIGVNMDGKEYLLPTVTPDGRHFTGKNAAAQAEAEFRKTGRHLGIFADVPSSNAYAARLHNDYAAGKYDKRPSLDDAIANVLGTKEAAPKEPAQKLSVLEMGSKRVTSDDPDPEPSLIQRVVKMGQGMAHPQSLGDVVSLALPVKLGPAAASVDVAKGAKSVLPATGRAAVKVGEAVATAGDTPTVRYGSKMLAGWLGLEHGAFKEAAASYAIPPLMRAGGNAVAKMGRALEATGGPSTKEIVAQRLARIPIQERLNAIANEPIAAAAKPALNSLAEDTALIRASISKGMDPSTAIRIIADGSAEYADALKQAFAASVKSTGPPPPQSVIDLMKTGSFAKLPQ